MKHSLAPVIEFLRETSPFALLSETQSIDLAQQFDSEYHRRGSEIRALGQEASRLYLIRSGALSEKDSSAHLVTRYGEGEIAGLEECLTKHPSRTSLLASEDSVLYTLSVARFEKLLEENGELARRLTASVSERLRIASLELAQEEGIFADANVTVQSLLTRDLVSIDGRQSVQEAAQLMKSQRVSALVITGGDKLGIITDRDLRNRVVSVAFDITQPVSLVMTSPLICIAHDNNIIDALFEMLRRRIHHLVVTQREQPIGLLSTTDLIRAQSENPVHVVGDIVKQTTVEGLARANQRREQVLARLVSAGTRAVDIHRILSRIGDSVTDRLIQLAYGELEARGLPPMPDHCWVVFGSLARNELSIGSDQDNALVLAPGTSPDHPSARFVAEWVCAALDECGYPKCNGEIMAMTPRYCQPVETWERYFQNWVRTPEKDAVMRASIFFDMRAVEGNEDLLAPLKAFISTEASDSTVFVAHMARDALSRHPPLGFFRQFVVEREGEHADTLDLKHRGLIPIVDLARVYSLEAGYAGCNTIDRLRFAQGAGKLSSSGLSDLLSAYEFIATLRLRHQAQRLAQGLVANSHLSPDSLSTTEKRHLRDAFKIIKTIQDSLHISHQLGALAG